MKISFLGVMSFLSATICFADVSVLDDGLYRPDRNIFRNLDSYVWAVDTEKGACVVATPAPRGFTKDDPSRCGDGR